ncbi:trihelix transcription factor ASIL1-like [Zingiber officinale]|uniref:Myb-like domain-containing protein n=1 Tax=Zingiber officinale TaxID=94328 RepID=A0A8J5FGI6_ZINOF|nr:trihelix transcription factor ASIL1-like [Zingiber officinale]KAG6485198.1 hypothetical protein ZIOFF_053728 [Zingiber officinale]
MAAVGGSLERWAGPPPLPPSRKSASGQPWSDIETAHLIDAYEERWYALKRGQLRAQQWEEVAAAVAARCGLEEPSKTGTQCRHKVEKLRKRYRAEQQRPVASAWPLFSRMERMERGPLPISVRPPATARSLDVPSTDEDDDEEEEEEEDDERIGSHVRSINGILREPHWGPSRFSKNHVPSKRSHFEVEEEEAEESDEDESEDEAVGSGAKIMSQLAAVVRRFSDGLMKIEKRRMKLMRELERDWMEMERKKADMIRESQQCLLDMIADAFPSTKKAKKSEDL